VTYLSMVLGSPYEDYSPELVACIREKLDQLGIKIISSSDTLVWQLPKLITSTF